MRRILIFVQDVEISYESSSSSQVAVQLRKLVSTGILVWSENFDKLLLHFK